MTGTMVDTDIDDTTRGVEGSETDGASGSARAGAVVLLNLGSGAGKEDGVPAELQKALDAHPGKFELRTIEGGDDIEREVKRAMADGFGTIVAAGGDGTICAVASHVTGTDHILGVIPQGTFNYFSRGLGIPEDPAEAVNLIAVGDHHAISVGEVNGQIFLNNASLGVYPAILRQRETIYKRWGRSRIAAHWSVIKTFFGFTRRLKMEVKVDGKSIRTKTPLVFVARSAFQLEQFGLDGADCVRRGQFALLLAPDTGRWALMMLALRLAVHNMRMGKDVELICGDEIVITPRQKKMLLARDGEREAMAAPFHFKMRKGALKLIAPAGEVE